MKHYILSVPILVLVLSTISAQEKDITYTFLNKEQTNIQAEFIVLAPLDTIWKEITDYEHAPEFLPNIKSVILLQKDNQSSVTRTTVTAGPFQVAYTSRQTESAEKYHLSWVQIKGPFSEFYGSWKLYKISENKTKIRYRAYINHPLAPAYIKRSLIKNSIPEMVKAVRKRVAAKNDPGKTNKP